MATTQTQTKGNGKTAEAPPLVTPPAATAALAKQEPSRPLTIRELIEKAKPKLAEVMPRHLSADRLVRVTLAAISRNPDLLACTHASLLASVMTAAQLGLEPTGVLGSAYLVPYNVKIKGKDGEKDRWEKQAQLIPGYRGLIDLARRSGQIESIEAHPVFSNERFRCHYGLDPTLEHEPAWEGDPGPFKAVYAIAKLKDGGKQVEVMTKAQVDKIMLGSQSGGKWGPWKDHYEEMARKTVVRRIAKYLPLTPELADAMGHEEDVDRLDAQALDLPALPSGVAGLAAIVKGKQAEAQPAIEMDPAHDEATGEILEKKPTITDEEAARRARELEAIEAREEAEKQESATKGDPPTDSERIDPTAEKKPAT